MKIIKLNIARTRFWLITYLQRIKVFFRITKVLNKEEKNLILMDLIDKSDKLSSIPHINLGGCGIVAYALNKYLYKNYKIKFKYGFLHSHFNDDEYANNIIAVKYNDVTKTKVANHIVLLFDDNCIDALPNGKFKKKHINQAKYKMVEMNENHLLYVLNLTNEWNQLFDRKQNIPFIEYFLNIKLNEINTNINIT